MKHLSLIFSLVASLSAHASISDQSLVQVVSLETRFQQIMQLPAPELSIQDRVQDMLKARYQARIHADTWRAEVHALAMDSERERVRIVPTQLPTYKKFRESENLAESIADTIVYFYSRLIQTARYQSLSANIQLKATMALNQVDQSFVDMAWIDRLQIEDLLTELRELRMIDGGNFNGTRKFPKIDYSNQRQLKAQVQASQNILAQRLADAKRIDRAQRILKKQMRVRTEQQETNVASSTPIEASTSTAGDVDGFRFPENIVALTFDDGPDPQYTIPIARLLNAHQDRLNPSAPATFFWQAKNVINFPSIVKEIVSQPQFSTNCHSWSHKNLTRLGAQPLAHEVVDAIKVEQQAYGRDVRFYRCPGGACSRAARKMMYDQNVVHAFWSIDSLDWMLKDADAAATMVIEQLKIARRGIVLMHDIHPYSVVAAEKVLNWIKQQNDSGQTDIRLYTLEDAVKLQNQAAARTVELKKVSQ